jgi:hypothetical protein
MSELRQETLAVRAVRGHLALLLVGEVGQGGWQVERGLGQSDLEQEAHGTQTQGQHGQRGPGLTERERVSVPARGGPPLSPPAAPRPGAGRQRRVP